MRRSRFLSVAAVVGTALVVASCGGDDNGTSGSSGSGDSGGGEKARIGVIFPDSESSSRWVDFDTPLLKAALEKEGLQADIQNAQNDKQKFATIADAMLNTGVKVLMMTNLDSPSVAAIQEKAKAAGVPTIDYDR